MHADFALTTPMPRTTGTEGPSERSRQDPEHTAERSAGAGWFRDLLQATQQPDGSAQTRHRAPQFELRLTPVAVRQPEERQPEERRPEERQTAPAKSTNEPATGAETSAMSAPGNEIERTADRPGSDVPNDDGRDDGRNDDRGDRAADGDAEPRADDDDDDREAAAVTLAPLPPLPIAPLAEQADAADVALLFSAAGPFTDALAAADSGGAAAQGSAPGAQDPAAGIAPPLRAQVDTVADAVTSRPTRLLVANGIDAALLPVETSTNTPGANVGATPTPEVAPDTAPATLQAPAQAAAAAPAQPTGGSDTPGELPGGITPPPTAAGAVSAGGNLADGGGLAGGGGNGADDPSAGRDGGDGGDGGEAGSSSGAVHLAGPAAARSGGKAASAAGAVRSPTAQVGEQLGRAVRGGLQRVEIALEPAALGRVDVRLEFGKDGRIAAHFTVDSREALDALRNDLRGLERALGDAGVRADAGSLGFSLRGEQGSGETGHGGPRTSTRADGTGTGTAAETERPPAARAAAGGDDGRLDIRA